MGQRGAQAGISAPPVLRKPILPIVLWFDLVTSTDLLRGMDKCQHQAGLQFLACTYRQTPSTVSLHFYLMMRYANLLLCRAYTLLRVSHREHTLGRQIVDQTASTTCRGTSAPSFEYYTPCRLRQRTTNRTQVSQSSIPLAVQALYMKLCAWI